ncbi:MAG: aromatic ring-hydroxylating dioxygenase subunit alpha [Acidobacteriia bacterium]|nr:aromatic ring-hydroxylating dioxygenase subunit alpha [Terriglobia bacterium]
MFLQDFWYAVAWDHEIKRAPFGRTVCGEPIVLYRQTSGAVCAFEDCCPHRLLPLSKGFLKADHLVCKYHGLEFDENGRCVWMPGQEGVRKDANVRAYPVVEKHRFVWVWIGDPAQAETSKIPDLHWCSDANWIFEGGTYHVKCNYQLLVDNLMDLSHETHVHPTSIGQQEIVEAPIHATSDEKSVTVTRWMHNIDPPPFWAANLRSFAKCDRWQICRFSLPANVMIDVGVALAGTGAPQGDRSQGVTGIVVNLMTPESDTTTWYHWGMVRDFQIEDRGLTFRIRDGQAAVFAEDVEILESQQENIERRPDRQLLNLKIDAGGANARRIIARELARTQAPGQSR